MNDDRNYEIHVDSTSRDALLHPLDIDHLRSMMVDALRCMAHLDVSTEDNGDIAIGNFSLPIHVCFGHDATAVLLHAPLVTGVHHSQDLSRKLSWLNSRWTDITFVVAGGQVFAEIDFATETFAPQLLASTIFSLGLFVDCIDSGFATELGGTVFDPTHSHLDELPKVTWSEDSGTLGTLRAACEATGGPVDSATVDALCRGRDLTELIERARWSAQQFRSHAHRLGDERRIRAAMVCDTLAGAWDNVCESLRRAVRPKPAVARRGAEQIQLFDHMEEPALFDVRPIKSSVR